MAFHARIAALGASRQTPYSNSRQTPKKPYRIAAKLSQTPNNPCFSSRCFSFTSNAFPTPETFTSFEYALVVHTFGDDFCIRYGSSYIYRDTLVAESRSSDEGAESRSFLFCGPTKIVIAVVYGAKHLLATFRSRFRTLFHSVFEGNMSKQIR